jgi:hypothetical protein
MENNSLENKLFGSIQNILKLGFFADFSVA